MKAVGERNGQAVLTAAKVRRIRRRYARGGISHRALARLNGVGHTTICQIVNRITWRAVRP